MTSLAKCLEIHGGNFTESELDAIRAAAGQGAYKDQKVNALSYIEDTITDHEAELDDILEQAGKQGWEREQTAQQIETVKTVKAPELQEKKATKTTTKPPVKEPLKVPESKAGWVNIKNKARPFTEWKEHTRKGKNQGKVSVKVGGQWKLVDKESVRSWPNVEEAVPVEIEDTKKGKIVSVDLTKKEEGVLTPKQQKAYLLAEIDKAIEVAPEEKERQYFEISNELKQAFEENKVAEKSIRKGYTHTLTEQDKQELERIDREEGVLRAKEWDEYAKYIDQSPDYVTIEVPGDGTFRIYNRKAELREFKKAANKFPSTELKQKAVSTVSMPEPSAFRKEDIGFLFKVKQKDWFTDGSVAIKGTPPKNAKYDPKSGGTGGDINDVIPKSTKPAKLLFYAMHDPDTGLAVSPRPIADIGNVYKLLVVFESQGKKMAYNQHKFNAIRNRYPNATYGATSGEPGGGPLVAYEKGKPVALIMPMASLDSTIDELSQFAEAQYTTLTPEAAAKQFNLRYDGQWEDVPGKPYQFTDVDNTKSTILVKDLKDLPRHIEDLKRRYGQFDVKEGIGYLTDSISIEDVKSAFPNTEVTQKDGKVWIKAKNGQTFSVEVVNQIDPDHVAFTLGRGRGMKQGELIVGKYQDGEILLSKLADKWTVNHEGWHAIEDKALTRFDVALMRNHIQSLQKNGKLLTKPEDTKNIGGPEDRANYWADVQTGKYAPKGPMASIIAKVRDFIDRLVNLHHRTARAVMRDVKTGKAFEKGVKGTEGSERYTSKRNIDTEAFKKWFGKSKVVDENGEPLVVYHGTATPEFEKFKDKGGLGGALGYWFATSGEAASQFARQRYAGVGPGIYPTYLSINKPMEYRGWKEFTDHIDKLRKGRDVTDGVKSLRGGLLRRGFDGIVIRNSDTDMGGVRDDWVAFHPTQIKSIYNRGTWNPEDARISYASKTPDQIAEETVQKHLDTIKDPKSKAAAKAKIRKAQEEFDNDSKGILQWFADNPKDIWVEGKQDTALADRIFKTPLHYFDKVPAMWRMFKSSNRKTENAAIMINLLTDSGDGVPLTKVLHIAKKRDKQGYRILKDYFVDHDVNQIGYRVKLNPYTNRYDLYGPEEKRLGKFKKYRDAQRAVKSRAEKEQVGEDIYRIIKEDNSWILYAPKNAPVKSFDIEQNAIDDSVIREVEDYKRDHPGASEDVLRALHAGRTVLNRGFNVRIAELRKILAWHEENGFPIPEVVEVINDERIVVDLKNALAQMGDRRGYYFPRKRGAGQYVLKATKPGEEPFMKFYDLALKNVKGRKVKDILNSFTPLGFKARELRKKGYQDIKVEVSSALPEDVFEMAGSLIGMQEKINKALERMNAKGLTLESFNLTGFYRYNGPGRTEFIITGPTPKEMTPVLREQLGGQFRPGSEGEAKMWHFVNPGRGFDKRVAHALANVSNIVDYETMRIMANDFMEQLANVEKARGFRQSMIRRNASRGKGVWKGYEEDPSTAITSYVAGMAGGESKKQMAMELIRYYTGTDISWDEFQRIKKWKGSYEQYYETMLTEQAQSGDYLHMPILPQSEFEIINDREEYKKRLKRIGELYKEKKTATDKAELKRIGEELIKAENWLYDSYREMVNDRRIDAGRQKNAFHDAKVFMQDLLRNDEAVDRILGTFKGVAVFKYLAGRPSALVINHTAMVTSFPGAANMYGDIPIAKALKLGEQFIGRYTKYRLGKGLVSPGDVKLFKEIERRGWTKAQLNREALTGLESKLGKGWNKVVELGMWGFGISEEMNRAASIAAAYTGLKDQNLGLSEEQLLEKAHEISDKSHSVYNKSNLWALARGSGIVGNIVKSAYVFKSFSHNYLQLVAHAWGPSWVPENAKAFSFLVASPAILAGTGALVGKEILFASLKALGIGGDDPEEEYYKWMRESFGTPGETLARNGAFGLIGINLKGSLSIGITDIPGDLGELLGAPWSVVSNTFGGIENIARGDISKGIEKVSPLAIGNMFKGYREATEGITTKTNAPVYYGNEPLVADTVDAFLRFMSFNPASISAKREEQWKERSIFAKYTEMRSDIYAKLKRFYLKPSNKRMKSEYLDIMREIEEYNARVVKRKLGEKGVPMITKKSIKTNMARSFRPSRRERLRAKNK